MAKELGIPIFRCTVRWGDDAADPEVLFETKPLFGTEDEVGTVIIEKGNDAADPKVLFEKKPLLGTEENFGIVVTEEKGGALSASW